MSAAAPSAAPEPPADPERSLAVGPSKPRLLAVLGPGLITGASDDDPSGIATSSQAGAQFGYALAWTMLLTYPLMAAVQMVAARVGRATGHGLAGALARHAPNWALQALVALLVFANTANLGADLGAMADAARLLAGGWLPHAAWVAAFGAACAAAQVFLSYARYARVLKWLTLSLLAYVAALAMVEVRWGEALLRLVVPAVAWDAGYLTAVVAVLGTTISPYLFFWQASQEAEDVGADPRREPLRRAPAQGPAALARIRLDTLAGMAFSNLVALAIILTTAATLHAHGVTAVETSAQAAEALRPIAGPYAAAVFAAGVIGTGLLAVPVLAGSAAYAVGEARRWPVGLARRPAEAKAFYATLAAATAVGAALNLTPIDPIEALYWAAVVNGVVAVPVLAAMMALAARSAVIGAGLEVRGALRALGWAAASAMALAVAAMAAAAAL